MASTTGRSSSGGSLMPWLSQPGLQRQVARRGEVRRAAVRAITAVSAAGMWAMLVTTAPFSEHTGLFRREDGIDAELLHEPLFLGHGVSPEPAMAPA